LTVSATPRKAGPFAGNGVTTAFPFTYKIFATTDVVVNQLIGTVQTVLVLGTDYAVAMNADQENAPGGSVNMTVAPANGTTLVLSSAVPSTQSVAVTNNGGFFPAVFNAEFDRLTILSQQLEEKAGRAFQLAITSPLLTNATVSPLANGVLVWDALGQNLLSVDQTTFAGGLIFNNAAYQAALIASGVATRKFAIAMAAGLGG
jgi:hypothetical protein